MDKTTNYNLSKPTLIDSADIRLSHNTNMDAIDSAMKGLSNANLVQTAGGTANNIILTLPPTLENGFRVSFVASANNNGTATTINGKKLYKPGTTIPPNFIKDKAYTAWYNLIGDCFFIKASAEGSALAKDVRKNMTFSNDNDIGIQGGLDLSLLISDNLKAGITIDGVTGKSSVVDTTDANLDPNYLVQGYSGYDDGVKKVGTLPNLGAIQQAVDTWTDGNGTLRARVPSKGAFTDLVNGYLPELSLYDANFVASNIVSGKWIFGVQGSYNPLALVAGDTITLYKLTTVVGTGSTTYTLMDSRTLYGQGGSVRIRFSLECSGQAYGVVGYARIYINGSPIGTERVMSGTTPVAFVEDFSVNAGDVIQLYIHSSSGGYNMTVQTYTISCGNSYGYIV